MLFIESRGGADNRWTSAEHDQGWC